MEKDKRVVEKAQTIRMPSLTEFQEGSIVSHMIIDKKARYIHAGLRLIEFRSWFFVSRPGLILLFDTRFTV